MIKESKDSTLGIYAEVYIDKLDYCNAFVRRCYIKGETNLILRKRELVSYCTPVLAVSYEPNGRAVRVTCAPAATCSATTRKHVGRFLNKYCPEVCYHDVKNALATPEDTYNNGLRVIELTSNKVHGRPDILHVYDTLYESIKPFGC